MLAMPCHRAGERLPQMDRKAKKPLMEKRRRARINKCLGELKNLLLEHLKRDPSQTSKLEKADILEMTVHLLRRMQQEQLLRASIVQPSIRDRFLDGWRDCANQVSHYANTVDGMPPRIKESLQRYLADRYRILEHTAPAHPITAAAMFNSSPTPQTLQHEARQRMPSLASSVFPPPAGLFSTTGIRALNPALYPPALNPSAFSPAATSVRHWNPITGSVMTQQQMQQTPISPICAIISQLPNGRIGTRPEETDSLIKRELQKAPKLFHPQHTLVSASINSSDRPLSSTSATRALAATPACFEEEGEEDDEDEEDSASCSSSDATNESESPVTETAKDNVWRPW